MARGRDFRTCHRCGIDIATGEGERSSRWDGADLPLALDVYCDTCRLHFFMCEADRPGDPASIRGHEVGPLSHVENMRKGIAHPLGRS
ncbi:MAG TPA: hypothetical protein VMR89_10270 [Actinomycetota bacterium]|nr:hypothetical protein [Actinomycetota bacterium]